MRRICIILLMAAMLITLAGCEGSKNLTVMGNDLFPTARGYENEHLIIDLSLSGDVITVSIANKTLSPISFLWTGSYLRLPEGTVYYTVPIKSEAIPYHSVPREVGNVRDGLRYMDTQNSSIPANSISSPSVFKVVVVEDVAEMWKMSKNHEPVKEVSIIEMINGMAAGDIMKWGFAYLVNTMYYSDNVFLQLTAPKAK